MKEIKPADQKEHTEISTEVLPYYTYDHSSKTDGLKVSVESTTKQEIDLGSPEKALGKIGHMRLRGYLEDAAIYGSGLVGYAMFIDRCAAIRDPNVNPLWETAKITALFALSYYALSKRRPESIKFRKICNSAKESVTKSIKGVFSNQQNG